jgi:hypothetical protein
VWLVKGSKRDQGRHCGDSPLVDQDRSRMVNAAMNDAMAYADQPVSARKLVYPGQQMVEQSRMA